MPGTESYPFRRLSVDHMVEGNSRVWWDMHRNFKDATPHIFQLEAGRTGSPNATDWVPVGPPVENATYALDDVKRLYGKRLVTHYRVKVTTGEATYVSNPVSVRGELSEADWVLAREITRKEILRHGLVSVPGILLKRRRYGAKCTQCLDTLTDDITDGKCPECHGTGFKVGYHAPIPMQCWDLQPEVVDERRYGAQPVGQKREQNEIKSRVLGYPQLNKEDVWVDATTDKRWFVHVIRHIAQWRGYPLVSEVTMRQAPFTDVVYRFQVGTEPDDHTLSELPTAGTGSEKVTHDFGGEDALVYLDGDCGILGATILAFTKEDYDAGLRDAAQAVASSTTLANGRWSYALCLDPGDYVLVFEKVGEYGPNTAEITVEATETPDEPPPVPSQPSSESSDFGPV